MLRHQIRAGLNMAMSGIPWWTTDIGGFFNGDPADPAFRELLVRWFEYGAFCPLFRLHGNREPRGVGTASGGPNEVWSYGKEVYEILANYLHIRERLRPYIMEQMNRAHGNGTPPMRPLFFDFAHDKRCFDIEDQFMLGPDLLAAPVAHENARSRNVYLPEGATWKNVWTEKSHKGGQTVSADAPLDIIPLFINDAATLKTADFLLK
jgi:alpha-D-xyloside xylohydrolase